MLSLLDIGPLTEEVTVRGKNITVYGLSPEDFFFLITSFPELRKMADVANAEAATLIQVAPRSIALAIAVATTDREAFATTAEYKAALDETGPVAARLSIHHQLAIINAAIRLTFPDGVGPFVKELNVLTNSINEASGRAVSVTASSKQSRSGFSTDSVGMRLGPAARSADSMH